MSRHLKERKKERKKEVQSDVDEDVVWLRGKLFDVAVYVSLAQPCKIVNIFSVRECIVTETSEPGDQENPKCDTVHAGEV